MTLLLNSPYPSHEKKGLISTSGSGTHFSRYFILGLMGGPRIFLIFDSTFTFFRRLRKGEDVFKAHRSHLYQHLVIAGYSHRFLILLYMGLALVGTILALLWSMRVNGSDCAISIILPLLCLCLWVFFIHEERQRVTK
ncbi:MAG: hypothetical protein ABSH06_24620 [Thermodesulfobacteriota bacterium]